MTSKMRAQGFPEEVLACVFIVSENCRYYFCGDTYINTKLSFKKIIQKIVKIVSIVRKTS